MKGKRDGWFERFAGVRVGDLVFLDEFGAATDMARTRGRGPRGERVVCAVPAGHYKSLSTVAAMTADGMPTAVTHDGAVNAEAFAGSLGQFLAPELRPGQVLVLDDLPAHLSPEVGRLVGAAGARVLRLPPYSPDFNPIEQAFSKVKALLRKAAARAAPGLIDAVGRSLRAVTAGDAINFIRHCGYGATRG